MDLKFLKPLLLPIAEALVPQLVLEGFGSIPDEAKPVVIHVMAPFKSEFAILAERTTGQQVDDVAVEALYVDMAGWAATKGFPNYVADADAFVQLKIPGGG